MASWDRKPGVCSSPVPPREAVPLGPPAISARPAMASSRQPSQVMRNDTVTRNIESAIRLSPQTTPADQSLARRERESGCRWCWLRQVCPGRRVSRVPRYAGDRLAHTRSASPPTRRGTPRASTRVSATPPATSSRWPRARSQVSSRQACLPSADEASPSSRAGRAGEPAGPARRRRSAGRTAPASVGRGGTG